MFGVGARGSDSIADREADWQGGDGCGLRQPPSASFASPLGFHLSGQSSRAAGMQARMASPTPQVVNPNPQAINWNHTGYPHPHLQTCRMKTV